MYCSYCGNALAERPPTRCPVCQQHHWNDPKPCAGALIVKDSRLLMIRRAQDPSRGFWDLPGGFCEHNEHPIQTAQREVMEEIGLAIHIIGFLGMWLDEYPDDSGGDKRTLNIYYHAVPIDESIVQNPAEVLELRFFAPSDLPEPLAFRHYRRRLGGLEEGVVRKSTVHQPVRQ
jgi:8-oxo-dGTP diphosphatase